MRFAIEAREIDPADNPSNERMFFCLERAPTRFLANRSEFEQE